MNHSVHLGPRIRFISGTINPQNGAIPGAMNCLEVAISGAIHCAIYGFKNCKWSTNPLWIIVLFCTV